MGVHGNYMALSSIVLPDRDFLVESHRLGEHRGFVNATISGFVSAR